MLDPWGMDAVNAAAAPPVLGQEPGEHDDAGHADTESTTEDQAQASVCFVPTKPLSTNDREAEVELRHTVDGQLALLIYSSLERLVESRGDQQAWMAVPISEVRKLAERTEAEVVAQDAVLPAQERHTGRMPDEWI